MRQEAECKECKRSFERLRTSQQFCCDQCRSDYHNRVKMEKVRFADDSGFVEDGGIIGPDYFKVFNNGKG